MQSAISRLLCWLVTLVATLPARAAPPDTAGGDAAAPLDFGAEARLIYRAVACGNDTALPPSLDAGAVAEHCADLRRVIDRYREKWLGPAAPFLASLRPASLPDRVVYPFGGGDLLGALATFPDAREYTLLSMERVGDPRPIDTLSAAELAHTLRLTARNVHAQMRVAHNRTEDMESAERDPIPAQLVYALVALVAHGREPTSLRFFDLGADGALVYLTAARLAAAASLPPEQRAALFANMELGFRRLGATDDAGTAVMRHIEANLDNEHLAGSGALAHLASKGRIAAMTKAATYLLWEYQFSLIRTYLLQNMAWMISDSTGISPRHATAAGFVQETYGRFEGPFLDWAIKREAEAMVALWKSQPWRSVPMNYGYPDKAHHWHLMVTRPAPPAIAKAPVDLGAPAAPPAPAAPHDAAGPEP